MKKSQKFSLIFLTWLLVLPLIGTAYAANTPSWIGVDEGQSYTWNTIFDEDPLEDYYATFYEEILGYPEETAETLADEMVEFDEDIVQVKVVILKLKTVDDDYVKFYLNRYEKEEDDEFELEDEDWSYRINKYDLDDFEDLIGLMVGFGGRYFVDQNIKWKELVSEVNDEWEDDWDGSDEKAECSVEQSVTGDEIGLSTEWNADEDEFEDFTSITTYTSNGVLLLYEFAYGGDPIIRFELQYSFVYQYFLFIVIGAAALIAIIIIIIVVKKE